MNGAWCGISFAKERGWRDGDGRYLIQVSTPDTVVINNAYALIDE